MTVVLLPPEGTLPSARDDDFGLTWVLLRPLPESDEHPGTQTARMRRALKALLRGYGIRVERITARGPDGQLVEGFINGNGLLPGE